MTYTQDSVFSTMQFCSGATYCQVKKYDNVVFFKICNPTNLNLWQIQWLVHGSVHCSSLVYLLAIDRSWQFFVYSTHRTFCEWSEIIVQQLQCRKTHYWAVNTDHTHKAPRDEMLKLSWLVFALALQHRPPSALRNLSHISLPLLPAVR